MGEATMVRQWQGELQHALLHAFQTQIQVRDKNKVWIQTT
jgi:hypothetical protein